MRWQFGVSTSGDGKPCNHEKNVTNISNAVKQTLLGSQRSDINEGLEMVFTRKKAWHIMIRTVCSLGFCKWFVCACTCTCMLPFGSRGQRFFLGYGHGVSVRLAATGATVSDTGHGVSFTQRCLTCTTDPEGEQLSHCSEDTHGYLTKTKCSKIFPINIALWGY